MARRTSARYFNARLTRAELIAGWCYLPFYLVVLSVLLQQLFAWLKLPLDAPNEKQFTFGLTPEKLTKQQVQKQAMDSVWTIAQAIISFLNQLLGSLSSS